MDTMERSIFVLALLLGMLVVCLQASRVAGETYSVNDHQIEVGLIPEKSTIMLAEPIYLAFVVRNHSEQDLQVLVGGDYRNALGRPESFTVAVTRMDGKPVTQPSAGPSMGGMFGPKRIPAKGEHTFKLFLPHWATFEEPGDYSIRVRRTLQLSRHTPGRWDMQEKITDVQVQAGAEIKVLPQDRKEMGRIIAQLGDTMLGKRPDEAEPAARSLSYIHDERVIPYFVKAFETNEYNKKSTAIQALSKFNNEQAFQAIKKALDTKGADIGNATTAEVADQSARNIRHTAAAALARSPHPQSLPLLLSLRNNPSEAIRITVLHAVGKMKPEQAIPILQEMTQDESQLVSDEAKRYLGLHSSQK